MNQKLLRKSKSTNQIDILNKVQINDLTEIDVDNIEKAIEIVSIGLQNRATSSTQGNKQSSRSHSIFQINLVNLQTEQIHSSLKIVDLAGSEKFKIPSYISQEEKDIRVQELTSINGSLSALGNCIQALTDKNRKHIPFRNSKLTRILSESLSGQIRTRRN
ncbi:P-loop containing nucleoside triphosphate hydrolase [Pseudocohnilembus persalinus]|uniref:p-loop containing nucleoside triphosphate hydrolase n=1 Tax=Pseudocohnilembus persalinus TaxID=266149 RepID=A0A0V0QGA9_PSEPJ|nr:P-loop containing nucleoside triphosphate hydrolase [Pseudocohnilembus persalinus]|eukprot:KRX01192.1 P-loop containing nucleoside triphosphate hydrolase [Pseudocohnilembus persalinus]